MAIWRRSRALGAVQLSKGTLVLPETKRNVEGCRALASDVLEAGGEAMIWRARLDDPDLEAGLSQLVTAPVVHDYEAIIDRAEALALVPKPRTIRYLQDDLRRVEQRDHFGVGERETARRAVERAALAAAGAPADQATARSHGSDVRAPAKDSDIGDSVTPRTGP
jgi:hypothetical protein